MPSDLSYQDQYIVNKVKWLLPEGTRLHIGHILDSSLIDGFPEDEAYWVERTKREMALRAADFILDTKSESIKERRTPEGIRHDMELIVMTRQEFAKYQSDLLRFIKHDYRS